ncbi:hypothetical protein Tsubulata_036983 [Turnera subulata]|uniref:Uncharacterized protein n=1 Tax=Turnera subulata TaxID=218843 RepID=A0A9Q0FQZ5_9ROSI|nr:hypothetical protein Tsubulata_036983 [Turnera subulata]
MCTALPTMSLLLATPTPSSTSLFSLASPSPSSSPSPPSSSCIVDFSSKSLRTPNPSLNHSCPSKRKNLPLSKATWLCGHSRRDQDLDNWTAEEVNVAQRFGSDDDTGNPIPMQIQSTVEGVGTTAVVKEFKASPDELLAIQQQGPRSIGFFGTRNMGFMHQELIEILSYALKNHIYTSGASGTNAAVIRGALRAEKPELLTVILPQSLKKQPPESQELLEKVKNVIEKPYNDHLPLIEASRLCNMDIISHVQQVICFAFHDSRLLLETCQEAKNLRKIVTLFYLD